ncbi:MAG: VOC family protein [Thermoplasmata archaeon]
MGVKPIPEGYHAVTPYLVVQGVAQLIDFMKTTFHAEEKERHSRPDGTVLHAEVRVGDSVVMMGEPTERTELQPAHLYMYVNDTDATYRRALEAGAESLREPGDQFYGDRTAGVKDTFGNVWWIATHVEDVPPEELRRRAEAEMARED